MGTLRSAVACTLTVAIAYAGLGARAHADPAMPAVPESVASRALEAAKDAIAGEGDLEPTLALANLYAALPDLSAEDRTSARGILARPDGTGPLFPGEPRYPSPGAVLCGEHVCVHYATTRALLGADHRPPATDANTNGVPDWVETTSRVMEHVYQREVGQLAYRPPLGDGTRGGDARLDVYLANVGQQGYYGYAQPEDDGDGEAATTTSHMVLDNDFKEFAAAPLISLKATAAHEFFHVVQFAYDVTEQSWLLETTATWMEEQVYDAVNDNRNFLEASSLRHPEVPLDASSVWYGNWVFFQYISERLGRTPIREIWQRASHAGVGARLAIIRTLAARGSGLRATFSRFSASSNVPARSYQEGRHFPRATVARTWTLSRAARSTGTQSVSLRHLTSRNYVFVPGSSLTGAWRLRVRVEGPSTGTTAYAIVRFRNGTIGRFPVALNRYGNGSASLRFSRGAVAKVYLNVGNAYSLDNRKVVFRATASR
jgi:hypothetical protein